LPAALEPRGHLAATEYFAACLSRQGLSARYSDPEGRLADIGSQNMKTTTVNFSIFENNAGIIPTPPEIPSYISAVAFK
jgi:hypothetical protein